MQTSAAGYERAIVIRRLVDEYYTKFVQSGGKDVEAQRMIAASVPAGLYEHWKSEEKKLKFYVVHGAGCEQDLYTPLVAYRALYRPHPGILTFRHLLNEERGFLSPVDREGYRGQRFKLVQELGASEISILLQYVGELQIIETGVLFRMKVDDLLGKGPRRFRLS